VEGLIVIVNDTKKIAAGRIITPSAQRQKRQFLVICCKIQIIDRVVKRDDPHRLSECIALGRDAY
jgi:hypothetical protein